MGVPTPNSGSRGEFHARRPDREQIEGRSQSMRKAMATLVVGVCTIVPLLVSSVPFTSYAQTAANVQGDEFNAGSFTAPFSVQCAPLAVTPCPDAQSATTWS